MTYKYTEFFPNMFTITLTIDGVDRVFPAVLTQNENIEDYCKKLISVYTKQELTQSQIDNIDLLVATKHNYENRE